MDTFANWWREPPEMPPDAWEVLAKLKSAIHYIEYLEIELEQGRKRIKNLENELDRYHRLLVRAEQVIVEQKQQLLNGHTKEL